jgi:hypothetical protein
MLTDARALGDEVNTPASKRPDRKAPGGKILRESQPVPTGATIKIQSTVPDGQLA